jgi:phage terminase large subunit-like protein
MLCNPREAGGDLWDSDDILHGLPGKVGRVYCWLDPPVTTKKGSDPAGITIAGYLPTGMPGLPALLADRFKDPAVVARLLARQQAAPGSARHQTGVAIFHAEEKRLTGRPLLRHVAGVVTRFEAMWGKRVRGVLCDVTQGGDLWGEAAEHLSLPFRAFTLSEGKEFRFTRTLDYYQALRVFHVAELPALERQQLAYPKIAHDDVLDSAAAAVLAFLEPKPTRNSETIFPT